MSVQPITNPSMVRRDRVTTRRRARVRASAGFTLIELMVAMVVSAIVVLGVFAFSSIQQTTTSIHERNVRVQQALEGAMWAIGQDVSRAGLGWTRFCTELRVYDPSTNQLINPGGAASPAASAVDPLTNERYWVLRDGIQAHWNSDGAASLEGTEDFSSSTTSAADALDVIVAEPTYVESIGIFGLDSVDMAGGALNVSTGAALSPGDVTHLAEVQQLFVPGSFVVLVPAVNHSPVHPQFQSQCVLLQVTGDVTVAGDQWSIPTGGASGFNQSLNLLLGDAIGDIPDCEQDEANPGAMAIECDDWTSFDLGTGIPVGRVWVAPLGQLRWSRYEIDYSIPNIPYLVRYDIIGHQPGVDLEGLGGVDYPSCTAGTCTAAGLHLPGSDSPPTAVAIGPMVEDLQVAVGCDGWTALGAQDAEALGDDPMPFPDDGFAEVGPADAPVGPNRVIDENDFDSGLRTRDEWLGNATAEEWAPDCVHFGTAEYDRTNWRLIEGTSNPPPAHRMMAQSVRISLTASSEFDEEAGGLAVLQLPPVEDRPAMDSPVGVRQRFTLTERFSPENLRWRNPNVL